MTLYTKTIIIKQTIFLKGAQYNGTFSIIVFLKIDYSLNNLILTKIIGFLNIFLSFSILIKFYNF